MRSTYLKWLTVLALAVTGCGSSSESFVATPPANIALVQIDVTPAGSAIANGTSQQMTATATFNNGSTLDVTSEVGWSSDDPTVATVSASGLAAGVAPGQAIVTATLGSVEGSTQLNVTNATLTALQVTPETTTIPVGISEQFRAQGTFSDGSSQDLTSSVAWVSADQTVATVSDLGQVTGVSAGGPVDITASFGGLNAAGAVTVNNAILQSIDVTSVSTALAVGFTQQLTATGHFSDGSVIELLASDVTWGSTDDTILTVDASGVAIGVSDGSAFATAAVNAVTGSLEMTVTPLTEREFLLTPNAASNTVQVRSIDLSTGQTMVTSSAAVGSTPTMVRVHPTRGHAYVTNFNSNTVSGLRINPDGSTGVLPGSPYALSVTGPRNVHIHPSGDYLYVSGQAALESFAINADGSITSLGTTATTVAPRNDGGFTSDGAFLHLPVTTGVQSFSIDAVTGVATVTTLTTIVGANPVNDVAVSPDGTLLLVNTQVAGMNNDQIVPYTVSNGVLTAQAVNTMNFDVGLGDFASNGTYYVGDVSDANGRLFVFTVSNVGGLTGITGSPFSAPGGGSQTAVDRTGRFVVSAANGASGSVNQRAADDSLQLGSGSPFANVGAPYIFDFYRVLAP